MNLRRISLSLALAFSVVSPMALAQLNASPGGLLGYDMATVRYDELLNSHKSAAQLRSLDGHISFLEGKRARLELEARRSLSAQGEAKVREAYERARADLAEQRASSQAQLSRLQAQLQKQSDQEMRVFQAELEAELLSRILKDGEFESFRNNLYLVRDRDILAKRLELEKQLNQQFSARKSLDERLLSEYQTELAARYQQERLNLQMRIQNSSDEQLKRAAQGRLQQISADVDRLQRTRRSRLESEFEAFETAQTEKMRRELTAYQAEVETEALARLDLKKRQILDSGPRLEARLKREWKAKQATMSARLQAEADRAQADYEAQEQEAMAELEALKARVAEELADLPPEVAQELGLLTTQLDKLRKQRQMLGDAIGESVNGKVEEIAKRLGQRMVIGVNEFEYSSRDLTDHALAGVSTLDEV